MSHAWLSGGGAAGALMRGMDWSGSPLGSPDGWPQSLRSVVGLLLGSKFPMFVAWGEALGFLYNDAYAEILGAKHPAAMGARFYDIWSEIWPDISPMIDAALRGEGTYFADLPLTMNRHGFDELTWFTFSYSPVRDETGAVSGMFCAVMETTAQVLADRRKSFLAELDEALRTLREPSRIMSTAAEMLGRHLEADRSHWARIDGEAGTFTVAAEDEWRRGDTPSMAGEHQLADFGRRPIDDMRLGRTAVIEGLARQAPPGEAPPALRAALATPLIRDGSWRGALCVHALDPRRWRPDEIELVRQAAEHAWNRAERARAELLVHESERRFRALVNATSDVVYRMSSDWREMRQLDGRGFLADMDAPSIAWIDEYVFPEDQPAVMAAIESAVAARGVFELEHRVRRADGSTGWTISRAVPLMDHDGQIAEWFGTASDVTETRRARRALEESAQQLHLATEAAEVGFWDLDLATNRLFWPPRVKQMFGISSDGPISMDDFRAGLHPEDYDRTLAALEAAIDPARREVYDVEYRTVGREDGEVRWVAAKGRGLFNERGECVRVLGVAIDISVRKVAETHLRLMVNELNHRVKNSLATVQAIAAQTLRRGEIPDEVREALSARLIALANAHDVLTNEKWSGASLKDLAEEAAAPYRDKADEGPFRIEGPQVFLPPRSAIALALAFHELATNAAKYGALSQPGGEVRIAWTTSSGPEGLRLRLTWRESGGPPVVTPQRSGFGSRLIQRGLAAEFGGTVEVDYSPGGLVCTVDAILPETPVEPWKVDLQLS